MAVEQLTVSTGDVSQHWVRAGLLAEIAPDPCAVVHLEGHTLAIVRDGERIFAVDNRCPHMGFPLDRGSVCDGILTCHWHHARFDLATGGTFDQWADDVPAYPVEVREGELWINLAQKGDQHKHHLERLQVGLERNISLVVGKAALPLVNEKPRAVEPFQIGLDFGTRNRRAGWGQGLTILGCLRNILPKLDADDRPRAIFHGLSAVANDCDGEAPRFPVRPLPDNSNDPALLKRWFRQFIEVRDAEGAERCIASAVQAGADSREMADMLFAAATDHRYIDTGHRLDFTKKAFEALDVAGWKYAERVLTSLASGYAMAERMEEANEWRHPIDLIALLETAFAELPSALESGRRTAGSWRVPDDFVACLLSDDPQAIVAALLEGLRGGGTAVKLAGLVVQAAALRIAHFPTSNQFGDWDTALHSFTFANAVEQGLRRTESPELVRGVFDAAMTVYLNRFLNVPATPIPVIDGPDGQPDPAALLREFPTLFNQRHQVNEAARLVVAYLTAGGHADRLLPMLGKLLLREDRDFHTIQMVEGAFRQFEQLRGTQAATHVLIAAFRYLAAHAPTMRAQDQTWRIVERLHRGEKMFE
jgi:nitrite reductase/ring-hydroxylating ferredoxin subunit